MDILSRPTLTADLRIPYGEDPCQFGDLWLPEESGGPFPLVVFFHGGWWKSEYDLGYAGYLCEALRNARVACWSVEYRRVGQTGGGWPATFQDAAAGFAHVATLAERFPLDRSRVLTMGHSAGGHLAFWIAGSQNIRPTSELYGCRRTVPLLGTISLAGAVDLQLTVELAGSGVFAHDRQEVRNLMGGTPGEFPARYKDGNPGALLPFGAPQLLVQGTADDQIPPELLERWAALAHARGDRAEVILVPEADHFDLVDPRCPAWESVLQAVRSMLSVPG